MGKRFLLVFLLLWSAVHLLAQSTTERPVITSANVDQIELLAFIRNGRLNAQPIAWSPDGSVFAMGMPDGVQLYSITASGIQPGRYLSAVDSARAMAFSGDGSLIAASAGTSGAIWLWRVETGDLVATLDNGELVEHVSFSPDSRYFASTIFGAEIAIWRVPTRSGGWQPFTPGNAFRVQRATILEAPGYVLNMRYTPDSETLVVLSLGGENGSGVITFWDMDTYTKEAEFPAVSPWTAFDLSDDGSLAAYGDTLATIHVITIAEQNEQVVMRPAGRVDTWVDALAFNRDGTLLAAAYNNSEVRIWEVETGEQRLLITDHPDITDEIAFNVDGTLLASRGWWDGVRFWGLGGALPILPPPTSTPRPTPSEGPTLTPTAEPELTVGGAAVVTTTGGDALNVRSGPGRSFDIVTRLPDGTVVSIIEGPQRADGFTWWKIRTADGVEGWAVEFADDEQTLTPTG